MFDGVMQMKWQLVSLPSFILYNTTCSLLIQNSISTFSASNHISRPKGVLSSTVATNVRDWLNWLCLKWLLLHFFSKIMLYYKYLGQGRRASTISQGIPWLCGHCPVLHGPHGLLLGPLGTGPHQDMLDH